MTHTKKRVEVPLMGTDRKVKRTRIFCEDGTSFATTVDGATCPSCGQKFSCLGRALTIKEN